MGTLTQLILFAGFAGITVFLGALLAYAFNHHVHNRKVRDEITHTSIAFGGGLILAAVALVLLPEGMETLSVLELVGSFALGVVLFFFLDQYLARTGGKVAQLLAMLMDFVPESIALGAVFATDPATGILLALFIGLQNLPESFNAFRDVVLSGFQVKTAFLIFFLLSFTGIAGALTGHFFLQEAPRTTALLMTFACGGIIYLIFQDIAPESKLKNQGIPALGAALGVLVGMLGEKLM